MEDDEGEEEESEYEHVQADKSQERPLPTTNMKDAYDSINQPL